MDNTGRAPRANDIEANQMSDSIAAVLGAINDSPGSLCVCCLAEKSGVPKHSQVEAICKQLAKDEAIAPRSYDVRFDRRRRPLTMPCITCGRNIEVSDVYSPLKPARDNRTRGKAFSWLVPGIAERILGYLPSFESFDRVNAEWLNCERGVIIRIFKQLPVPASRSLSDQVSQARTSGQIPGGIAVHMHTLLGLRNVATYDDRSLDFAETLIARVAADEVRRWWESQKKTHQRD
jgi:hypothetical protein